MRRFWPVAVKVICVISVQAIAGICFSFERTAGCGVRARPHERDAALCGFVLTSIFAGNATPSSSELQLGHTPDNDGRHDVPWVVAGGGILEPVAPLCLSQRRNLQEADRHVVHRDFELADLRAFSWVKRVCQNNDPYSTL
jgi:hypothetical protein